MSNRKKINSDNVVNKKNTHEKDSFQVVEDGSAVRKEINQEQIPVHYRPQEPVKKKNKWVMPVLLTISTAAVIGTILGMFILQLFVDIEEETGVTQGEGNTNTISTQPAELIETDLPSLSAYVLQAGMFTEQANAEEWKEYYEALGESAFIWESEEQHYLFIGIYGTEEQASEKLEELQSSEVDVFMKKWETTEGSVTERTTEEIKWIEQFQVTWEEALAERETSAFFDLINHLPSTHSLEELNEYLSNPNKNIDLFFFELMNTYEQM